MFTVGSYTITEFMDNSIEITYRSTVGGGRSRSHLSESGRPSFLHDPSTDQVVVLIRLIGDQPPRILVSHRRGDLQEAEVNAVGLHTYAAVLDRRAANVLIDGQRFAVTKPKPRVPRTLLGRLSWRRPPRGHALYTG